MLQDGDMGQAGSEKYRLEEAQRLEKRVRCLHCFVVILLCLGDVA